MTKKGIFMAGCAGALLGWVLYVPIYHLETSLPTVISQTEDKLNEIISNEIALGKNQAKLYLEQKRLEAEIEFLFGIINIQSVPQAEEEEDWKYNQPQGKNGEIMGGEKL